jgi:uncharacterized protein
LEIIMSISDGRMTVRQLALATLGVICVALGIIGVFVPGLPTTEFLIAASYLFARSSPALNGWLETNRWLGPPLRRFRATRGMPRTTKAFALASMWTGIGISIRALTGAGTPVQALVLLLGIVGTITILFVVRTTAARQSLILS